MIAGKLPGADQRAGREVGSPHGGATAAAGLGDVLIKLDRGDEAAAVYRSGLEEVEDLAV